MTIDDLAKTIAAGFRAMKNELRAQRTAIEQTQEAVVQYSRSVEDRDAARLDAIARLRTDVDELRRKVGH